MDQRVTAAIEKGAVSVADILTFGSLSALDWVLYKDKAESRSCPPGSARPSSA